MNFFHAPGAAFISFCALTGRADAVSSSGTTSASGIFSSGSGMFPEYPLIFYKRSALLQSGLLIAEVLSVSG